MSLDPDRLLFVLWAVEAQLAEANRLKRIELTVKFAMAGAGDSFLARDAQAAYIDSLKEPSWTTP